MNTYKIVSVTDCKSFGKWAEFECTCGYKFSEKYGSWSYLLNDVCDGQLLSKPEYPIKTRLWMDDINQAHIDAVWHKGLWVKLKPRGIKFK